MTERWENDILQRWTGLTKFITVADEQQCLDLLAAEKRGQKRLTFLLRIHSRLNKVRADRERATLVELSKSDSDRAKQLLERAS